MNQQDSAQILQYLNDCGEQFNTMMREVIKRLLGQQIPSAINPFVLAPTMTQTMSGAVKLDPRSFLQQQVQFWRNSSAFGTTPLALLWVKCRSH